ncbi:SCO7613 C-terminal domain-containing membrane protein [Rhabdothermincola salaria]|uniref:SCO7613 C-terminal domain-containing membrane protein n=1 Tax=Rhabdothermincola salaria TaxID=2903142 RepID=UPI001E3E9E93|nr:hypothetical protein [Rhabdothermincola salaria]MCD9625018.1 hypothetical protein [Rhabdothermincola salaria]
MPDDRPPGTTGPEPPTDPLAAIDDQLRHLAAARRALIEDREQRLAALAAEEQRLLAARAEVVGRPLESSAWSALPPPPAYVHLPPPPAGAIPADGVPSLPPSPPATQGEWRPQALRNTLLAVGAVLLALAALVFAVVAWPRLGDGGRAALLAGATFAVAALTVAAARRLPATAEALAGVLLALVGVDWLALRRVGVGAELPLDVWWVAGLALVGAIGVGLGAGLRLAVGRQVGPLVLGVALGLALTVPRSAVAAAVGAAALAAVVALAGARLSRVLSWRDGASAVTTVAWLLWAEGLVATGFVAADRGAGPVTAAVLATSGVLPLATRWAWRRVLDPALGVLLVTTSALVVLVVPLVAVADLVSGPWLATIAVASGAVAVVAARVGPSWLRAGSLVAGVVVAVPALLGTVDVAVTAGASAWLLLADPWATGATEAFRTNVPAVDAVDVVRYETIGGTGAAAVALLVVAATALVAGLDRLPGRRLLDREAGVAAAVATTGVGLLLAVVGAGASYAVLALLGVLLSTVAVHLLARWCRSPWWALAAAPPLVAAAGWSLADAPLTLAVVGLTGALAGASAWLLPRLRLALVAVAVSSLLGVAPAVVVTVEDAQVTAALPMVVLTTTIGAAAALVLATSVRPWGRELRLVVAAPATAALALAAWGAEPAWAEQRWPVAVALGVAAAAALAVTALTPMRRVAQGAVGVFAPVASGAAALGVLAGGWSPEVGGAMAVLVASATVAATPHVLARHLHPAAGLSAGAVVLVTLAGLAARSVPWPGDGAHALAVGLTLGAAGAAIAGLEPTWRRLELVALALAVVASWSWLGIAGVGVVEAYTAPTAVVCLGAGWVGRRGDRSLSSWFAYAPGLLVGVLPSLVLALDGDGSRAVGVAVVCLGALVVGTEGRLQAPVTLGAVGLVVIGLHTVAPVAAQIPRWAVLAVAGVVSLWLGATVERRLRQARRWVHRFGDLA